MTTEGANGLLRDADMDQSYEFNGRQYRLAATNDGWLIITGRPGELPVRRYFAEEPSARKAWARMLAATIACRPHRLRSADVNGTLVVLVIDSDGRTHLGELAGPAGDAAVAYTDRAAAVTAWRDRCCELARAATPGDAGGHPHEVEKR